jgi:anti-anti-sigma factor
MALLISRELGEEELLETEIRRVETHALVVLAGEVDVSTVGQLYERLAGLAHEGVCHVSLNVAEVTFIDSTGLSVLVTEHKRMESMKGELIIFRPSYELRRLFQITGLDDYLNIRPKRALRSMDGCQLPL